MKWTSLLPILLLVGSRLVAQEAPEPESRSVPFTFSLIGPLSTNWGAYETTNSFFCLGLINCSLGSSHVLSLSYGYNVTEYDMEGLSFAALGNYSLRHMRGVQASFLANTTARRMLGLQISFVNLVFDERMAGAQIGAFNMNLGDMAGAQIGIFNYAHQKTTGLQVGFINSIQGSPEEGRKAFAVQYGFLNYSNQPRVLPVGLINIVRGGRMQLELNHSVIGTPRIEILMGSRYFYSIWTLDSKAISSQEKKASTQRAAVIEGLGLGAAWPFTPGYSIRAEQRYYHPTKFRYDFARVVRIVLEQEWSYHLAFSIGLEKNHFIWEAYDRSPFAERKRDVITALTAGLSVNLFDQE